MRFLYEYKCIHLRAEIKKNDIKNRSEPLTATWVSPSECFWHLWAHPHHPSRVPPPGAAVRFWWMLAWTHSWPHQSQPVSESSLAEVCPLTAQGSCLTNKNESTHSVTMVKLTYQELIFTKSGIWVYSLLWVDLGSLMLWGWRNSDDQKLWLYSLVKSFKFYNIWPKSMF